MEEITNYMLTNYDPDQLGRYLAIGKEAAHNAAVRRAYLDDWARPVCADVRRAYGLKHTWAPISTDAESQHKLGMGSVYTMGQTFYHYVFNSKLSEQLFKKRLVVNLCPKAGDCTKVCVVENGHGGREGVQTAWRWRTDMLLHHAPALMTMLGWELERKVMKYGHILDRPDVNSDAQWELICPSLVDGSVFGDTVKFYGYTKLEGILDGDGWVTPHYRKAFSANENKPWHSPDVLRFLGRGGSVAVVTNRKPKVSEVAQWATAVKPYLATAPQVHDADVTDEWIFTPGIIGDLSAKGRARKLIGNSGFVTVAY